MSFSSSSQNVRLDGTYLIADCRDEDGNWQESSIDLNAILGNFEGQFDFTGANFADSADFYQLSDTTLVARLANLDGDYADASIDLDSVVTNNNGRLEKAQ
ncbi:Cyanovirin-N [Mycena galericulata]|nr:Cyanovirin-N [Mycena galericulata]